VQSSPKWIALMPAGLVPAGFGPGTPCTYSTDSGPARSVGHRCCAGMNWVLGHDRWSSLAGVMWAECGLSVCSSRPALSVKPGRSSVAGGLSAACGPTSRPSEPWRLPVSPFLLALQPRTPASWFDRLASELPSWRDSRDRTATHSHQVRYFG
jgi:hypothetical protein